MFCENCGKELDQDARFCIYCGAGVQQESEDETIPLFDDEKTEIIMESSGNCCIENSCEKSAFIKGMILKDTYQILEKIGTGGGGIVYRAWHLGLQKDVVVKKIKDKIRGLVQIRREADILKKLKHPYLPIVYDFIEREDGVYTVIDFIHGENLDKAVRRYGRFPQKLVKKWAEQLGSALEYLHSQNPPIIHSDIKPSNIMLTKEGDICLIDFNIALAMGEKMESAVGISAGFSPPEQYRDPAVYARFTYNYMVQKSLRVKSEAAGRGDTTQKRQSDIQDDREKTLLDRPAIDTSGFIQYIGRGIDVRSDIYSLGVTLYYILTGIEPPMDFNARLPIAETGVPVSEGFVAVLEKMMELAPENRYQSGGDFLKAVKNCYKLDIQYIMMRRKQMGMQAASLICLGLGIVSIFGGLTKMRMEQNTAYYGKIQQAQEVMNMYEFDEAEALLEDAKELSEVRVEAYEKEVYLLYLEGVYERCINTGENYINTMPFMLESKEEKELFGNIYYIVGNAYFELEDYSNAKKLLQKALEYNTENGLYYRDYAIALAKLGQIEKAEEELKKGIDLGIAEDSIYMAQGEITHVKGAYEEAIEYFNRTISLTDDMEIKKRAILLCADVYKTVGNDAVDDEIVLLEKYKDQFEGNGSLVMTEYLAEAYARKAGREEAFAEEYYQKALTLFSSICEQGYITYQLQENMAILYENMNDFSEAEKILSDMAEDYPERYEVYKRLAYLEADKQQEKEKADRDYRKMQLYYKEAKERYEGREQDMEMDMLDGMMQDLRDGGWLQNV